MQSQRLDILENVQEISKKKKEVIRRKPALPKELKPEDLPHSFKFCGNGRMYRIVITPKNNLQMIRP